MRETLTPGHPSIMRAGEHTLVTVVNCCCDMKNLISFEGMENCK